MIQAVGNDRVFLIRICRWVGSDAIIYRDNGCRARGLRA